MVLAHEQTHKSINIIESSVINPHIYGKLFYNKGATIHNGEKTVSSISGDGKIRQLHVEE